MPDKSKSENFPSAAAISREKRRAPPECSATLAHPSPAPTPPVPANPGTSDSIPPRAPRPSKRRPSAPHAQINSTKAATRDPDSAAANPPLEIPARAKPPPRPAPLQQFPESQESRRHPQNKPREVSEFPRRSTHAKAPAPMPDPRCPAPPSPQIIALRPQPSAPSGPPRPIAKTAPPTPDNVLSKARAPASASMRKSPKNAPAPVSNRRRRCPAARSARCPLQIPRAVRPPVKRVVRLISHQKFRHIRIPQQNRASPAQSRHQRSILRRHVTPSQTAPTLARPPSHIHTTLHRNRHAVQQSKRIRMRTRPRPDRSLRNRRLFPRALHIHIHKRIQLRIAPRVQFRNPPQMRIHQFHGRNRPRTNLLRHLHSGKEIQIIHCERTEKHANAPASLARTPPQARVLTLQQPSRHCGMCAFDFDAVECPTQSERESNDPLHPRNNFPGAVRLHPYRSQPRATTATTRPAAIAAAAASTTSHQHPRKARAREIRRRFHHARPRRKPPRRRNP